MQPTGGRVERLHIGHRRAGSGRFSKNLGGLLAQLEFPARDLGRGQLVESRQFGQRLTLGERGQRYLGFKLGLVTTAGAFGGS